MRAWATLLTPYADDEQGFEVLPEVDTQVVVAFEAGDLRRPYIVGSCWNGKETLPEAPDGAQQQAADQDARRQPARVRRHGGRREGDAVDEERPQAGARRRRQEVKLTALQRLHDRLQRRRPDSDPGQRHGRDHRAGAERPRADGHLRRHRQLHDAERERRRRLARRTRRARGTSGERHHHPWILVGPWYRWPRHGVPGIGPRVAPGVSEVRERQLRQRVPQGSAALAEVLDPRISVHEAAPAACRRFAGENAQSLSTTTVVRHAPASAQDLSRHAQALLPGRVRAALRRGRVSRTWIATRCARRASSCAAAPPTCPKAAAADWHAKRRCKDLSAGHRDRSAQIDELPPRQEGRTAGRRRATPLAAQYAHRATRGAAGASPQTYGDPAACCKAGSNRAFDRVGALAGRRTRRRRAQPRTSSRSIRSFPTRATRAPFGRRPHDLLRRRPDRQRRHRRDRQRALRRPQPVRGPLLRAPPRSALPENEPERHDCHGELIWSRATEPYRAGLALRSGRAPATAGDDPAAGPRRAGGAGGCAARRAGRSGQDGLAARLADDASRRDKIGKATRSERAPEICSFSIPLITIVATFVFQLFLPIVMLRSSGCSSCSS